MVFRRSGQLALQIMILLALGPRSAPRRIRELAAELDIGPSYLTKVVQDLARVGLLRAVRGPGGGVQLARPAEEISPWEVLAATESMAPFTQCLLGAQSCNEAKPCPLHAVWAPAREQIRATLQSGNLQQFAVEAEKTGVPFWKQGSSERDREWVIP
jgi:Rrf2 family iron-sulfur cluster assembly transcriptional regulator